MKFNKNSLREVIYNRAILNGERKNYAEWSLDLFNSAEPKYLKKTKNLFQNTGIKCGKKPHTNRDDKKVDFVDLSTNLQKQPIETSHTQQPQEHAGISMTDFLEKRIRALRAIIGSRISTNPESAMDILSRIDNLAMDIAGN